MTTAEQPIMEPPTYVVGVGASSSEPERLEAFLAALPAAAPLAYVVVGTTSGFDDVVQERLAQRMKLRLQVAEQGESLQRGCVYLMPAASLLQIDAGRLRISPGSDESLELQPVNALFRSLAQSSGPNAIGVLLSAGSDGVLGACAIYQAGGLVLAQSDLASIFQQAPASQQATHVHLVHSPTELAQLIDHHVSQHAHLASVETSKHKLGNEHHVRARDASPAKRTAGAENRYQQSRAPQAQREDATPQIPVDQQLLATYDRLLDRYMPASILVNSQYEVLHVFGGAEKYLHYRSGRPPKQVFEWLNPSLRNIVHDGLTQVIRSGDTVHFPDIDYHDAHHSTRLSLRIEPSPDPDGLIDKVLIVFDPSAPVDQDVEVVKRASSKPHRAFLLEHALDATAAGFAIVDATREGWPILYANLGFEKLTGYPPETVVGKSYAILQGPDTDPEAAAQVQMALSQGRPCQAILLNYKHSGEPFWNDLQLSPVVDEVGNVTHFVGVLHDVTDLVHRERAISESEWDYRSTYDHAAVGIAHLSTEGRWVRANQRLCEMLGYNRDELLGMTFQQLVDPEDLQGDIGRFQSLLNGECDSTSHESRFHHRDGHIVWVLLNISRQMRRDGQIAGCIAVVQDITQRKLAEIALEKARRMADSASRAKSSFVTNISHELRSPMTAVLGFADMLANEIDVPEQLQKVQTLKRNGKYLLRLLDDILDQSKIESRRFQSDTEPCDLMSLLDEVEVLMQSRASQLGSRLWFHFPTPLPKTIYTSSMRVRQILVNLIANAFKFPLRGDVNVTIRYRVEQGDDKQEEPYVEFEVADTGVEIGDRSQAAVFTPFTPADPEIAQRFAGRGSGLSITKRLVSAVGGMLEFTTGQKGGSTFLARLPVGEVVDMELIHREARIPDAPALPEPSQLKSIAGKILVADDRRDIWRVTKYFLERSGAEVDVAEDGRQAVDAVQAAAREGKPFDLLLLDMQMPVMNGLEAVRELREAGFLLPIIALTADAMKGERQRCLAAGCDDYLTKPIDVVLLTETVAKHLGEKA